MDEFGFLMEATKIAQEEMIKAQAGLRGAKLSLSLCEAETFQKNSGALPGKDVSARKAYLFLECYEFEVDVINAESRLDIAKAHLDNVNQTMKHYMANVRIGNTIGEWITDG